MMTPRILIADDHEIVREGVRTLIERARPTWEICGEASNGNDAIHFVETFNPDVVILDLTMPGLSGLEVAARLKAKSRCRVVVFTMHDTPTLASEVQRVGAHGYVLKSEAARNLIAAIESVLSGGTFYGAPAPSSSAPEKPDPHTIKFGWTLGFAWNC
jgi:DNA-binding NarL/FixJ family response regulator